MSPAEMAGLAVGGAAAYTAGIGACCAYLLGPAGWRRGDLWELASVFWPFTIAGMAGKILTERLLREKLPTMKVVEK